MLYRHSESDYLFICGDFNARIGDRNDCLLNPDVPPRRVIDSNKNSQGSKLLSFLGDMHCCILNGRITPELDDFTSLASHKGKVVVDYAITRQTELDAVQHMQVVSCSELVNKLGQCHMYDEHCKLPDHNLLIMKIEMSMVIRENLLDRNLGSKNVNRKKIYRKVGSSYMESEAAMRVLPILLSDIENLTVNQNNVNKCYEKIITFVLEEAEKSVQRKGKKRE